MNTELNPKPFKVHVSDEEIERTKVLLQMRRLPNNPAFKGATLDAGTEYWWMHEAKKRLIDFDWRGVESKLNSFAQFTVVIEGATIHYIHEKSNAKNAIPLLLLHGWPSTILEFHKVIGPLVNPPEGTQAFDVVVPSLPGVGYSTLLPKANATVVDNARIFDTLMTEVLGYKTYVGQGGDFGSINLRQLQINHSATLKLALFQSFFAPRPPDAADDSTLPLYEQGLLKRTANTNMGYFLVQSGKVSTIGLMMYDNPQAYLAWLGDKYLKLQKAANLTEEVNQTFMDEMYAVILFQQYTATIHTAMAMYQHSGVEYGLNAWKNNPPNQAPFGVQHFEGEFFLTPQSWIKNHGPLIWHKYHERGGHLAAIGCPKEFVDDCRTFFGENYWKQAGVGAAIPPRVRERVQDET